VETYSAGDPNEVGTIEVKGRSAVVLMVEDGAFTEENPLEVVEGADTIFVLVRRGVVEKAARQLPSEVVGREVLEAAQSALATWLVLSE